MYRRSIVFSQHMRRYRGVGKVSQDSWQARYELEDEAVSIGGAQMPEALDFL